ncbi:MAG: SGNH/GDSL hydrolase family protein [Clostridia bacterium]|nr:SGNH/GDSL hydrolase family protein [Clostridia bacterium]
MLLKDNMKVLFQGDSVTDCDRSREDDSYLGYGYPAFIAEKLNGKGITFINRAVSGERVSDVYNRREKDIFEVKPDLFSILIGVNDTWRRYDENNPRSAEEFEAIYRGLLSEIKERLPGVPIVMMAPFVLEVPDKIHWLEEDLIPKQNAVRRLAKEFADVYIPLDEIFKAEFDKYEDIYYLSPDGVHPNETGHKLIANCWVNAVTE